MNTRGSEDLPVRILGAGASGQAAAILADSLGHSVQIFDEQAGDDPLEGAGVGDGLWVVSPGFSVEHPWCVGLREAGARLISELEFGAEHLQGEIWVVTGSLGKTSMVLLMAEWLRASGHSVTVSGNIGTAVSEIATTTPVADIHLIEASSFQLEILDSFAPDRAVCLNVFPNHLDRHRTMEAYARAKGRLFEGMKPEGIAVWPESYPVKVETQARRLSVEPVRVPPLVGTRFEQGPLRENLQKVIAVLGDKVEVSETALQAVLRNFSFPEHRFEEVLIPGLGRVVDDSKSTCLSATHAALEMIPGTVHLFMGGIDKGEDLETMGALFRERNPRLYLFGRSGKKMQNAWQDSVGRLCPRR